MRAGSMKRARGFDARADGLASGFLRHVHEHVADALATVTLVDDESSDPAPGAIVVRHWHEEVRRGPDKRPAVVGNEHIGPRISEHGLEPTAKCVSGLRMAQLVEQASELISILDPSRANAHCSHPGRV